MAKKKTELSASVALVSENPSIKKPRLVKLIIRNFRCIGKVPVEIDLNDIVVLVGPNNVGKSSILKAYELVMSQGSNEGKLNLEDFPNGKFDPDNLPEIELLTVIYENTPGEKWIGEYEGEMLVRERWIWHSEGNPIRQGWDTKENIWSDEVPWGAPNVANSRRPQPHRVNAFDPPDLQARAITDLLMKAITDRVKALKADDNQENEYLKLLASVKLLQSKIVEEAQGEIDKAKQELTGLVEKVFPGYQIDFDAKPNDGLDKSLNLFKGDAQLLMGPKNGYLSTIDRQGSGARRTLLWTALKYLSESNQKVNEDGSPMRPHLLLLDEPEICLHPNAVRDACNVLYELPSSGHWQVMVTTHSPVFIDFSRDNTTIVRVDRNHDGNVKGTTVFRPDKVKLTEDDKLNLKLLNLCDPYVAEFFFGGKTIIVEGDTEYTAFKYIIAQKPNEYRDVHIIRARGKATIVSLTKIMNQFGSNYAILHDSDTPKTKSNKNNPAWGNNPNILSAIGQKPAASKVRLLASLPNFEQAYFNQEVTEEKPYNALRVLQNDAGKFATVEKLFTALIDYNAELPDNCIEWSDIEELRNKVEEILK